jgi:3-dehydroquinate synthase
MKEMRNIVLTGFMGTGKTSVGREVAARLGREFVDLDDLIAERAGKSIPDIFADDGEAAFRELESEMCRQMAKPTGLVIATGGGAVVDPGNREALEAGGALICLEAEPQVIVARLAGGDGRPMLTGRNRPQRIADLLAERAGAYAAVAEHLDTSRLSVSAAAERVMGIAADLPASGYRMPVAIPAVEGVAPATRYDILIAGGLLRETGARLIEAGLPPGRCAVVTNPVIREHHADGVMASLRAAGFEPLLYEVLEGESHKTLATVSTLYDRFAADRLTRGEPVIALGGGVIGDLAGFAAATWLRGVPFVQIPTSLLAMVDASIGGKVGVDLPSGKNLVGAFKQPALVLIDPEKLATLPSAEFRSGLAEVLKAAIIGDAALFERIAGGGGGTLAQVIADAARVKVRIVERDPLEQGDRAWLNLGHTFGHALEVLSGYGLRHGEAVALGTIAASEMSAALEMCARDLPVRVRSMVERLGLPQRHAFDPQAALAAMGTDKKRRGRALRFIVPLRIGQVATIESPPEEVVLAALETIRTTELPPTL